MHNLIGTSGRWVVFISICFAIFFFGCGGDAKQEEKPKVVREKIAASKETPATAPVKTVAEKGGESEPAKAAVNPAAEPTSTAPAVEKKPAGEKSAQAPALTIPEKKESEVTAIAYRYDPKGKIDPFEPLFRQKEKETGVVKKGGKRKRRIPSTPLEKVDLSQLKLVATLRASSGDRALVEDATGKGYIIKKGTYIGTNSGIVLDIKKDRVIVEEEVESILGEISIQKRELKLQKPPGE